MKKTVAAVAVLLLLASCEKAELPVPAHDPGTVITNTVNMEINYKWQIYFDLGTNSVVGQNLKSNWDLGFETSANGFHVVLNSAKAMYALNSGDTVFAQVTDTAGFAFGKRWDEASGNFDSTAVGDWTTVRPVYIIDRGYNENGQHQGFRKLRIESGDAVSYTIRFAAMNGSGETVLTVPKDSAYNFTFVSMSGSGQIVQAEPPKADWDIVFTQFTHIFYNPTTPYLVTGCLLNRHTTAAARDSTRDFSEITLGDTGNYVFSGAINTVGYDWKSFSGSTYVTHPEKNFIIRDREGFYYKLHFIDFYDQAGNKGNPKWEFQRL
ncbi:MAG: hypothetical protein FD123_935 [Bacteroidetes bacterium]|nr:MAG: hypothetical protein FD123_935 [Bacteroidota bacterium]